MDAMMPSTFLPNMVVHGRVVHGATEAAKALCLGPSGPRQSGPGPPAAMAKRAPDWPAKGVALSCWPPKQHRLGSDMWRQTFECDR